LFRYAGIYQPKGQLYEPVDADTLAYYRESTDGQILQEGICEAGAIASFMAAGTAYSLHGLPMIPFYIFYSIFGFQRVGDMIWACGDMMCKGFLLGGTSGRTTLNGEGVQHQDGHSHVLAGVVPNLKSYDPAFAYELAVIVKDGIERMYHHMEKIFYYITITNENILMPARPKKVKDEEILRGVYRFDQGKIKSGKKVHLLGSGAIITQTIAAKVMLEDLGVNVDMWSVTSYQELERDAIATERENLLSPKSKRKSIIEEVFGKEKGVFVSASDYMKTMGLSLSRWMPEYYGVLGTDGFGVSESRETLRDHFEVSPKYIVLVALNLLVKRGDLEMSVLTKFMKEQDISNKKINPAIY